MDMKEAYDKYYRLVWYFVRRKHESYLKGSSIDPEDIAQDVFLRICQDIADGNDMTKERISSLVSRSVQSFYREELRRSRMETQTNEELDLHADTKVDLDFYYDEMTSEISAELGLPRESVDAVLQDDRLHRVFRGSVEYNDMMPLKYTILATAKAYLRGTI